MEIAVVLYGVYTYSVSCTLGSCRVSFFVFNTVLSYHFSPRLHVTGTKFYCSARATHHVSRGNWYFEVKIVEMPEGAAARIGWAQKNANLQAPLGFDKFGYR